MSGKKIVAAAATKNPVDAMSAANESLKMLVSAWSDYKKTAAVESTKRASITAQRDVRLAEIEAQRKLLEDYLKYTFQERAAVISKFFDTLDRGIENGDSHLVDTSIGAILDIARQSPLAQARELLLATRDSNVKSIEI